MIEASTRRYRRGLSARNGRTGQGLKHRGHKVFPVASPILPPAWRESSGIRSVSVRRIEAPVAL